MLSKLQKKYPLSKKKSSFRNKLFLYFSVTTGILFFLFTIIISASILKNYKKSAIDSSLKNLDHAAAVSENTLMNIYNYSYFLFNNDVNLNNLLYAKSYTPENSIQFAKLSSSLLSYYNLIDSFYVINFHANMAFCSTSSYSTIEDFYEQDMIDLLKDDSIPAQIYLYLPRTITSLENENTKPVLTLIFRQNTHNAFIVNLNQSIYASLTNRESDTYLPDTIISNNRHEVIAGGSLASYGSNLSDKKWYQEVLNASSDSGFFNVNMDGRDTILIYKRNLSLGFTYISSLNLSIFSSNNNLFIQTILYFIIFMCLSLLLSIGISWVIYLPISKLNLLAKKYNPYNKEETDEIGYLNDTLSSLLDNYQSSKRTNKEYLLIEKNKFLKSLIIHNTFYTSVTAKEYTKYSLTLEDNELIVILFLIDNFKELMSSNLRDYYLLENSLLNIADEYLWAHFTFEHVIVESGKIGYIVNVSNHSIEDLMKDLDGIRTIFCKYFDQTLTAGVGTLSDDMSGLNHSFLDAETALRYRFIKGSNTLLSYTDISYQSEINSIVSDAKIVEAITSLSDKNITEALDEFFDKLKSIPFNNVIYNILALNISLQKIEQQYNISYHDILSIDGNFYEAYTFYDIRSLFTKRCENNISQIREIKVNFTAKPQLIQTILDYIEENLCSASLTPDYLASMVNISTNYLRSIFKEHMGISLSNYITKKKIEYACKILVETDDSIQSICETLDFTTPNYFYTYFKKHTGMTPTKYRETNRPVKE